MIFEQSFFEEEIRCDFLVTKKRKKIWAVELNMLEILDDICKRHGLRYFVDYGTLLGAVRHKGFIPWDDDIDVTMFRDDYEKFKQVAKEEIKEPYFLQNVYTDNQIWAFSKIRDSRTSAIEFPDIPAEHLNQGIFIDIFPLDDVPDGINMQTGIKDIQRELWGTIVHPQVVLEVLERGKKMVCDTDLLLDMIRLPIRERMKEFEAFNEGQFGNSTKINFITDEICNISPCRERSWYESIVYFPFENMKVPVPVGYHEILKCQYGDYTKFVQNGSAHEGIYMDPDTPYYLHKRKRLLMVSAEKAVLMYNIREIAEAYRKLGWEVYCRTANDFNSGEIDQVIAKGIDRVFVINNTGWIVNRIGETKNYWDQLGVPSFDYILDHPMYYDDTLSKAPNLGSVLCVDKNHVQFIKRFYPNIRNAFFLPLGGDNELDGLVDDWNERKIDVLYVGGYKGDLDIAQLPEGAEDILAKLLQNMNWTTECAIENEIKEKKHNLSEMQIKDEILNYKALDWYIMTYIRVEVIRTLIRGGVSVTVYGFNWEKFEYFDSPYFIYKGCISPEECMEKMKESKIVLNVMPWFKQGTHDRVINAMLAGAVSLTDGSGYMDDAFEKDKDYICYDIQHLEQLPEIVRGILSKDNVEMRMNAYRKAKEQHRWYQRIEELEREAGVSNDL